VPKILIADDEADLLTVLRDRFAALGFEVLSARDGVEAVEQARQGHPDVIILDLMMPRLNGFQACRRIKDDAELSGIPVIMLTAKDSEADRFWGAEVGAELYLAKPADPANVVHQVQELLAKSCPS